MSDNSAPKKVPSYESFFEHITPNFIEFLRKGGSCCLSLDPEMFKNVQVPDKYGFMLKYMKGTLCNDTGDNPIAKYLDSLLQKEPLFFEYLKGKVYIITMSEKFSLFIKVYTEEYYNESN